MACASVLAVVCPLRVRVGAGNLADLIFVQIFLERFAQLCDADGRSSALLACLVGQSDIEGLDQIRLGNVVGFL